MNASKVICMLLGYVFIAVLAPAILIFQGTHEQETLETIGKALPLAGLAILFLQPLTAARYKGLERPFGLDIKLRFHRNMAVFAALLLLLHPVVIAAAEGEWSLLYRLDLPWHIWSGKLALLFAVIMVLAALFLRKLPLPYNRWRGMHILGGPVVLLLGFLHSIVMIWGHSSHHSQNWLKAVWPVYFAAALLIYLHHNVLRPRRLARHKWTVQSVTQETPNVWTLSFAPPQGQPFKYLPGQFHFITLHSPALPVEEHHFTISSSPENAKTVTSTIKNSGDFTSRIGQASPGDAAVIDGPYGRFSHTLFPYEKRRVFIAGGVGVTPVMSMLRHMRDTGDATPATLLYASSTLEDVIFKEELDAMDADPQMKLHLVHVISHPPADWKGESGHITSDMITKYAAPAGPDTGFYICGPEGLRHLSLQTLQEIGVDPSRIHLEIYRLV